MAGRKGLALGLLAALLLAGCLGGDPGDDEVDDTTTEGYGPPVPEGTYRFDVNYAQPVEDGVFEILPMAKTYLASDIDGVDIEVGVWLPDVPEGQAVPVIADAGPYYGNDGPPMDAASGHLGRLIRNFVPHGYAVAGIAVRGTGGSGGCMDLMGQEEVSDLDQAVTWLGTQGWSNGNVGMVGKSYDGSTPWMVASVGNPHLKTIVPVSGVPDVYELMFRNGTAEIRGPFLLNGLYYSFAVRNNPQTPETPEDVARLVTHTAEGLACPDHAVGLTAALYAGIEGGRDPTGYWAERNLKPGVEENYNGSVFLIQGLQDWNVDPALSLPWGQELADAGIPVYQMLGQWGHDYPDVGHNGPMDPNMRWDWAEILLDWFDRWLKEDESAPLGPPVQVLDDMGRWRVEEAWPPKDATWQTLNLSAGGELVLGDAAAGEALLLPQAVGPGALPVDLAMLPGARADFRMAASDEDLLIAGLPLVHVDVVPYGAGGSLAAYLYAVAPDGTEDRLGHTQINLRFADGSDQPTEVVPGQRLRVKMQIQPMDAVVPAGHELMLRVWAYRDDAAGDTVQGRLPALPPGAVMLQFGGDADSILSLPTIARGEASYFEPPRPAGGEA